ncbi:MAG: hypothetical protein EA356_12395 [Geminicoccaceae bacterium]|nr:MAG: hypothetical protein EA356_12395 [Geminicoccaceae bacterium]
MHDEPFEGEKFTITKVELALLGALALVVACFFFLGLNALVVLGVVLTFAMLVLVVLLASGTTPPIVKDNEPPAE